MSNASKHRTRNLAITNPMRYRFTNFFAKLTLLGISVAELCFGRRHVATFLSDA